MYRGLTVRAWPKTSAAMLQDLQLGLVENEGEYIYIGQLTLRILGIFMKERLETFIPFRSP